MSSGFRGIGWGTQQFLLNPSSVSGRACLGRQRVMPAETTRDAADESCKKAARLEDLADLRGCIYSLKKSGEAVKRTKTTLMKFGLFQDAPKQSRRKAEEEDQPAVSAGELPEMRAQRLEGYRTSECLKDCQLDLTPELHRNFRWWPKVPPAHLMTLCEAAEPIVFDRDRMQRRLCKRSQRVVPSDITLELIEFMTDIDLMQEIPVGTVLLELAYQINSANLANGRRARELPLPPHWPTHGHWHTSLVGGRICMSLLGGEAFPVPQEYIHDVSFESLHIDQNFAKHRAVLQSYADKNVNFKCEDVYEAAKFLAESGEAGCINFEQLGVI